MGIGDISSRRQRQGVVTVSSDDAVGRKLGSRGNIDEVCGSSSDERQGIGLVDSLRDGRGARSTIDGHDPS